MERIKQALEKARQERQTRQGTAPSNPAPSAGTPASPGQAVTQQVTVDSRVLRDNKIIAGLEPNAFTDAYNLLRTHILQSFNENNWNTLAVTSTGKHEGKTLTAINLAISIARELDHSVLLVDANMRHPWMLEHLGIAHRKGLSDYLTGDVPLGELLIRPESIEHLVILPGGQPLTNSAEMLNSPRMGQLVEEMKARYTDRIIIFDLPPVLGSSDALAFAPHVDAALLVVSEGITQKQDIEKAVDLLSVTNIVGTVLNMAEAGQAGQ
jgi:exopolysaccharide/PEP-CTERM locus tyrosine autokinase